MISTSNRKIEIRNGFALEQFTLMVQESEGFSFKPALGFAFFSPSAFPFFPSAFSCDLFSRLPFAFPDSLHPAPCTLYPVSPPPPPFLSPFALRRLPFAFPSLISKL
jgi:hypothetical protein